MLCVNVSSTPLVSCRYQFILVGLIFARSSLTRNASTERTVASSSGCILILYLHEIRSSQYHGAWVPLKMRLGVFGTAACPHVQRKALVLCY